MPGTRIQTALIDAAPESVPTKISPGHDPLAGTDYRLVGPLGRGGMSEVVLAEHHRLGHVVVIKLLRADVEASPRAVERMRLEAQSGARIRHPNLVEVHDLGATAEGRPFIVMEYLKGQSLHDRLRDAGGGPLPLREALDILCQMLGGLEAVHAAGLVHRDLKPGNVFLCDGGMVKLIDFGLAKVVTEALTAETPAPLGVPTTTGAVVGTPRYMAPEQLGSSPVEPRTDIYAVGLIAYRLLTGRGPFDGARDLGEFTNAHLFWSPQRPSSHLAEPLPAPLDELILRCLDKKPEARMGAAELGSALGKVMDELERSDIFSSRFVTAPMAPATPLEDFGHAVPLGVGPPAVGWVVDRPEPRSGPNLRVAGKSLRDWVIFAAVATAVGALVGLLVRML